MAKIKIIENERYVQCWFYCEGCKDHHAFTTVVPPDDKFVPWTWNKDVEKPTFTPSLLCNKDNPGTRCHSFVTDGKIQYLGDCWHELKNQTIVLPDIDNFLINA